MKKLVLICGVIVSLLSVGMGAMSQNEWERAVDECFYQDNKNVCQTLIDNGLASVEQCGKDKGKGNCYFIGAVYYKAGHYREAIPYFEIVIALGDNRAYTMLGFAYYELNDYFNAKKYFEIGCNKVSEPFCCFTLGGMYYNGQGVRQDYHKARELWKKACDMKKAGACNNLGVLYNSGQGVKQNLSMAKQYFGKACYLGVQSGCDNYKALNEAGVQ